MLTDLFMSRHAFLSHRRRGRSKIAVKSLETLSLFTRSSRTSLFDYVDEHITFLNTFSFESGVHEIAFERRRNKKAHTLVRLRQITDGLVLASKRIALLLQNAALAKDAPCVHRFYARSTRKREYNAIQRTPDRSRSKRFCRVRKWHRV